MTNSFLRNQKGFTLVEIMLAFLFTTLIVLGISKLVKTTRQSYTSQEAHTTLSVASQKALNAIQVSLSQNKRLFQNNVNGNGYLAGLTLSPPRLAGLNSQMPILRSTGSLSPNLPHFDRPSVGNLLFFAAYDKPEDVEITIGANTFNFRIDTYRFYVYYLAEDTGQIVDGKPKLNLWEFKSMRYGDKDQTDQIPTGVFVSQRRMVRQELRNNRDVPYLWEVDFETINNAFWRIGALGFIFPMGVTPDTIKKHSAVNLTKHTATGGYRFGVSPNRQGKHPVPLFAASAVAPKFPSGFEVVTVGPWSARQVFMRLVMVAEGLLPATISREQTVQATVRDVW